MTSDTTKDQPKSIALDAPLGFDSPTLGEAIAKIDAWLAHTGLNDGRLSLHACAHNNAVARLRRGGGRVVTLLQIMDYIERFPDGPRRAQENENYRLPTEAPSDQ